MAGNSGGRLGAGMWARRELRSRVVALVALGVLAGVASGVALAAVAGARRTDSAWDRLRAATDASDAIVFTSQAGIYADEELRYEALAGLPYVDAVGAFGLMLVAASDGGGAVFLSTAGDWLDGVDTPRVIEGRAPTRDAPHEVVISPPEDDTPLAGVGVGDTIAVRVFTQEQMFAGRTEEPEGPAVGLEVVGIGRSPFELAAIPSAGDVYVGPGFRERYGPGLALFSNLVVKLDDPERDVRRLEAAVARHYPGRGVPVYELHAAAKRVTNGTDLERSGLLLFAFAVAATGLVVVGGALTRSVRAAGDDVPTLAALGCRRRDRALAVGLPHGASVVTAAVVACGVAVLASSRLPIGLGRRVDPDVGWHLDVPVVVGGAAAIAVVLAAAVAWSAWRAASAVFAVPVRGRAGIASRVLGLGAPVTVSMGVGLALEPGRGQRALPTRPAIIGMVVGVMGVVGGLTLAAGIDDATTRPERFGAVWDLEAFASEGLMPAGTARRIADVPGVDGVARLARIALPVREQRGGSSPGGSPPGGEPGRGAQVVPFYAIEPVEGTVDFVLLEGRPPRPGEVALGPDSADALGVGVGDTVTIGAGGRFRVAGVALLPTTPHSSFDQGGWLRAPDLVRSVPDAQAGALLAEVGLPAPPEPGSPGPGVLDSVLFDYGSVLTTVAEDADVDAVLGRVERSVGPEVVVESSYGPADQANLRSTRPLPLLFAAFACLLALGALLHISSTVLRRRRHDLAVLRVLGLTRRQTRACLAWQATTLAVVGLVLGVPLGVILGRAVWRAVASQTPMVYVAPTAVVALVVVVPAALVVANLVATVPARRAARLRPAEVLRTE